MPKTNQIFAWTDNEWKDFIKKRDGNVCRRCGFNKNLHAHHIMPKDEYPSLEHLLLNGVTLCGNCHSILKNKEKQVINLRGFLPLDSKIDNQLRDLCDWIQSCGEESIREEIELYLEVALKDTSKWTEKEVKRAFDRGRRCYKKGEYDFAIKSFDKALLKQSDFPDAYYFRGCAKYELKQYISAIFDYNNAISLKPDAVRSYIMRGIAKYELKQYTAACIDFDMVLRLNPDEVDLSEIYRLRGWAKYWMGQLFDAIDDCNESLQLSPDNANTYRLRGLARRQVGQFDGAIKDFSKAIDFTRDKLNSLYYKYKKNKEKEAKNVASFLQLLYINRGNTKRNLGSTDEALRDFQEADRLAPQTIDSEEWCTYIQKSLSDLS